MTTNNTLEGWNDEAKAAAARIARREGTTAEAVARAEIRAHERMSGRGSLYRANIVE